MRHFLQFFMCSIFFLMQSENHSGQEIGFLRHLFSIHQSKLLDHLLYCRYQAWLQGDPDALLTMSGGGLLKSQHVASAGCEQRLLSAKQRQGFRGWKTSPLIQLLKVLGRQEGAGRPGKQWETQLKHEVQGSLGVERPFTLWNPVFLLAWQLLQNKFKVVLQMMPWRLSRSHLNCLFVICKHLPNLQPTVAVRQSLVYGADIVSWVIIFLKPLYVCVFYSSHLANMPR